MQRIFGSSSTGKMIFRALLTICLLAGWSILQAPLEAQTDTGSVAGTVTDSTGAVIPGANVTATSTDNGLKLTAQSSSSGEFKILAVPRGHYTVLIAAKGFQSQSEAVTITVTTTQNLIIQLMPSGGATTIEVTAATPLLNTADASMGATIQGAQVTELPLNGRNFSNLALLTPGVTRGAYGDSASGGGSSNTTETIRNNESGSAALSVNGLRPQANNYILDGVDNNDGLVNTVLFFPSIDATQEFKVDTSVAPAEYGRAGGAIVVSSIKSGTNQFHGSVFEFYRSSHFDSNPNYRFNNAPTTPASSFNRNQPGFSVGGPLIKNHLFIFGDYQALREALPVAPHYLTVPTALMRTGNFTELENVAMSNGSGYQSNYPRCTPGNIPGTSNPIAGSTSPGLIYDPTTCQPFAGNIIPTARLNPAAVNYLNAYPMPTRTDRYLQNYLDTQSESNKYNTFDVRLDWNATSKDLAFFRYSYDNSVNSKTSEFANLPAGGGTGTNPTHARGYDLGYTHIFSQSIVNEAHIAYNRDNYGYTPPMYGDYVSKNLGIVNANINMETTGGALIGGYKGDLEYTGDYGLYSVPQNTYEATDSVSVSHGDHSFKFGGTFIRRQVEYFNPQEGKGYFWIDGLNGNTVDFTGYEVSELLAGGVDNYEIGSQSGYFANIGQEDGIFGQDDWRVNHRLTLNLGVRWDYLSHPYEAHNQQAAFDVKTGTVLIAGKNGVSDSIINQDYHAFAPRFGFTYDLYGNGKAVLRGGYGIFYFLDYGGIDNQLGEQAPFGGSNSYLASNGYCITFTGQLNQSPVSGGGAYNCTGYTGPAAVTTSLPARGYVNFNPAAPPAGTSMIAVNQNDKNSMIQEWNVQLERQFGSKDVLNIAYVGTKGEHLSTYYPYNINQFGTGIQNFPGLGSINYNEYNGISNYNALQVHAEHRANNGLTGTLSYSWSHTLDDSPGAFQTQTAALYYDPMAGYGNSSQDQRHVFSSSILYLLPFGHGQRFGGTVSRPMDWLIGGWQTSLIALVQSGTPVDLSTGQYQPGNRPDLVAPITYPKSISGYWFNPSAFSTNIPTIAASNGTTYTRLGTLGRNQVYGPGYRAVNFSAQKNIHLTDKYTLELHGDAFNLLNTAEFVNPNSNATGSNFGQIEGTQVYSNREIQLAARFTF
ncbi:TonB-dependent receptor [Granulicella sp. S156]|uniref:TonB-dependent receptor n=1 Tax=Granulicella sp. S156 TaxID=1747224 RepID=UPI001575285C|nr:TonB-dependent receptor [Granulicella sp. S156]